LPEDSGQVTEPLVQAKPKKVACTDKMLDRTQKSRWRPDFSQSPSLVRAGCLVRRRANATASLSRIGPVPRTKPVDDFSLAYERSGAGAPVLLLHGWPGDRGDYRALAPLLRAEMDVIVPDLRGFGESDKHAVDPREGYSAIAQTRSVIALIDELELDRVTIAGYDIGSRVAQTIARTAPSRVHGLVIAPPLPGAGERVLSPTAQREFWYQAFHQLRLAEQLVDGDRAAVRAYLEHFWTHWSGPSLDLADRELDRLVALYAPPGAFTASLGWYRAGSGTVATSLAEAPPAPEERIAAPTVVLWPDHDPLFPPDWGDRLDEFFSDVTVIRMPDAGHFSPLEAPEAFAGAIRDTLAPGGS
jgi:pimeloyl-ACP methyl ester carboxylesterase